MKRVPLRNFVLPGRVLLLRGTWPLPQSTRLSREEGEGREPGRLRRGWLGRHSVIWMAAHAGLPDWIFSRPGKKETAALHPVSGFGWGGGRGGRGAQVTELAPSWWVLLAGLRELQSVMRTLYAAVDRPCCQYEHEWEAGDLIVSNNLSVAHRAGEGANAPPERCARSTLSATPTARHTQED